MEISQLKPENQNTWTQFFTAICGSYQWLNDVPIHYFATTLSILNLHDDIKLMEEIVGIEKWGFEALFQRVIKRERVNQMTRGYLEVKDKFKFFPPVTIALLPCVNDLPQRDYNKQTFEFEKIDKGGYVCKLDGLEIYLPFAKDKNFQNFGTPTQIKWDRQKFAALAIDGQHRISALRDFTPRSSQLASTRDVPATILIFDTKLPQGRDLIQATREIFIDINKNAKTVDASRLILLDDRNFYNGLTRKLITRAYEDGENQTIIEFDKINGFDELKIAKGIPQELIDTAAGKEATDVGKLKKWQFTSAFILNKAIQHFIFENSFARFEEIVDTSSFPTDSTVEHERKVAEVRLRLDDDEDPITDKDDLTFDPRVASKLVDRTMDRYSSIFLGVFTGFTPYLNHIEKFKKEIEKPDGDKLRSILLSEGSLPFNVPFANFSSKVWRNLDPSDKKIYEKRIDNVSRPQDWESSIVWYSVFQRGILYQMLLIIRCLAEAKGTSYSSRQDFASDFIGTINYLYTNNFFNKDFQISNEKIWEGIVLKINPRGEFSIDGGDSAAKKCGNLIRLLAGAVLSKKENRFDDFLKSCTRKQGIKGAYTCVCDGYEKIFRARDAVKEDLKDDDYYKTLAKDTLQNILISVSKLDETI